MLAEAIAVSIVTVFYLAVLYRPMTDTVMKLDEWVVADNRRLWLFVAVLLYTALEMARRAVSAA